ncbi:MAG: hypothetical protein WCQ00_01430 [bacterium]
MIQLQTWGSAVRDVWVNTASNVIYVLLNILVAILIFSAGWIAADFVGKIVGKIIGKLKLDRFFKEIGLEKILEKGNIRLNTAGFVEGAIKWFVIALFFMAALQVLGLDAVAGFIQTVLVGYLPKVLIAVLIMLVSLIFGEVIEKLVVAVSSAGHLNSSKALGALSKWAIVIFAVLASLVELDIAPSLIQILFIGIVSALSLAFGLAFGLGGRDHASKTIESVWEMVSRKK